MRQRNLELLDIQASVGGTTQITVQLLSDLL
jgi:hypothetical protein